MYARHTRPTEDRVLQGRTDAWRVVPELGRGKLPDPSSRAGTRYRPDEDKKVVRQTAIKQHDEWKATGKQKKKHYIATR